MHKQLLSVALVALLTALPTTGCTNNDSNDAAPISSTTSTSRAFSSSSTPSARPTPITSSTINAPQPTPAEANTRGSTVIGYTGAPGQDNPRLLNKAISSCGDPQLHQTGTTFFTDGTSGWTQHCATQMTLRSNQYPESQQRMETPSTPTFNPDSGDGYGPNQTLPPLCERIPDAEQCQ